MSIPSSSAPYSAEGSNRLLAVLPEAERHRLFAHLELVPLPLGKAFL